MEKEWCCVLLALGFVSIARCQDGQLTNVRVQRSGCGDKLDQILNAAAGSEHAGLNAKVIGYLLDELRSLHTRQDTVEKTMRDNHVEDIKTQLQGVHSASTYIRWGRKSCPGNNTLVYSGFAGGKQYNEKGSGTNRLCLTNTPQFDNTPKPPMFGHLYGGEYENIGVLVNHNVPCSVCLAPQATTIMIPATLTCPSGWTTQYNGHLAGQYYDHFATDYVCLDGSPDFYDPEAKDENGLIFYHVVTVCGSLPCPPYVNGRVVTCVVCSK